MILSREESIKDTDRPAYYYREGRSLCQSGKLVVSDGKGVEYLIFKTDNDGPRR